MSSTIVVVGSINMDLVVRTDEIPNIGETVLGNELLQIPGGKGANQGVSMAKLGNEVIFLGKVGNDEFGDKLLNSMKNADVNMEHIEREYTSTGVAVINVDEKGNNNIVVIPGANQKVDGDYLNRHISALEKGDVVVFQLEIPIETVKEGLKIAKRLGKTTVLNPAPAYDLDEQIIENVDILIPNEHELGRIAKRNIDTKESLVDAANVLLEKGVKEIIVTLGSKGVCYVNKDGYKIFDAYKVEAVDTTAAGDSFIGGFVSSYIKDKNIDKAIDMGQKAAALTIQKIGAQSSLPTIDEVENFNG